MKVFLWGFSYVSVELLVLGLLAFVLVVVVIAHSIVRL
jgi:hypothetical protein